MLGRLDMSMDECVKAYSELSATVFAKKHRMSVDIKVHLKERYDSKVLEQAIKQIVRDRNLHEDTLLKDPQGTIFGETQQTSLLRSWHTSRGDPGLYRTVRIWEAARATSAAPGFFDTISIGDPKRLFLDGGTGAHGEENNRSKRQHASSRSRNDSIATRLACLYNKYDPMMYRSNDQTHKKFEICGLHDFKDMNKL
ncbi:hypothetical protein D6D08_01815 [Aureobasidium pullulans]|nr:hypothetical protein D6D08_01815 [Aureobasidium pullulans]